MPLVVDVAGVFARASGVTVCAPVHGWTQVRAKVGSKHSSGWTSAPATARLLRSLGDSTRQ